MFLIHSLPWDRESRPGQADDWREGQPGRGRVPLGGDFKERRVRKTRARLQVCIAFRIHRNGRQDRGRHAFQAHCVPATSPATGSIPSTLAVPGRQFTGEERGLQRQSDLSKVTWLVTTRIAL